MVQVLSAYTRVVEYMERSVLNELLLRGRGLGFVSLDPRQNLLFGNLLEAGRLRGTSGIMSAIRSRQAVTAANILFAATPQFSAKQLWRSMAIRTTNLDSASSRKLTRVSAYSCARFTSTSE